MQEKKNYGIILENTLKEINPKKSYTKEYIITQISK